MCSSKNKTTRTDVALVNVSQHQVTLVLVAVAPQKNRCGLDGWMVACVCACVPCLCFFVFLVLSRLVIVGWN